MRGISTTVLGSSYTVGQLRHGPCRGTTSCNSEGLPSGAKRGRERGTPVKSRIMGAPQVVPTQFQSPPLMTCSRRRVRLRSWVSRPYCSIHLLSKRATSEALMPVLVQCRDSSPRPQLERSAHGIHAVQVYEPTDHGILRRPYTPGWRL